MRSRFNLILALCLCAFFANGQDNAINLDSLNSIWNDSSQPDTARLQPNFDLACYYKDVVQYTILSFDQRGLGFAEENWNIYWQAKAINIRYIYHALIGESDKF